MDTRCRSLTSLQRSNRWILQPKPTGQIHTWYRRLVCCRQFQTSNFYTEIISVYVDILFIHSFISYKPRLMTDTFYSEIKSDSIRYTGFTFWFLSAFSEFLYFFSSNFPFFSIFLHLIIFLSHSPSKRSPFTWMKILVFVVPPPRG